MSLYLKKVQEVRAEKHVVLHNDDMAVAMIQKSAIQAPLVVLRQPCMARLHLKGCQHLAGNVSASGRVQHRRLLAVRFTAKSMRQYIPDVCGLSASIGSISRCAEA